MQLTLNASVQADGVPMQYVPDILEKRAPHREEHLKAAQHQVRHEYT